MSYPHASKSLSTLTLLREQQSVDEEERSTVHTTMSEKESNIADVHQSEPQEQEQESDLYTPLSPDEADENQLAQFFDTLDFDVAFAECDNVINNIYEVSSDTERHRAKRSRTSTSGDSFASSFSDETEDYDELARKNAPSE